MTNKNDLEFDNNVLNFKLQLKTARVDALERQVANLKSQLDREIMLRDGLVIETKRMKAQINVLDRINTDKVVALATQTARADRLDHCLNVANQGLDNLLGNYFGESTDRLDVIDDLPPDLS